MVFIRRVPFEAALLYLPFSFYFYTFNLLEYMRLENSFIVAPGVGEKTETKLWQNNITHWDEIEDSSTVTSGKKDKITSFLEKARKNLEVENTAFFKNKLPKNSYWRMYENFRENVCFFDIETTGLDQRKNKVTTVSIYRNGESKTFVRGQDLTAERLQDEFFKSSMIVSFNGKRFDQPFLEHNFDLNIESPHIDLMYPCRKLGYSGGLKKIEKELEIERDLEEDTDGKDAIRLWKKYEKKGDQDALEKLVRYNQYDTENLQRLLNIVHEKLDRRHFRKHIPSE